MLEECLPKTTRTNTAVARLCSVQIIRRINAVIVKHVVKPAVTTRLPERKGWKSLAISQVDRVLEYALLGSGI